MRIKIADAKNIGPKCAAELESIGVHNLETLQEWGWEETFLKLIESFPERLNLNMATSLIGAVEDCHWQDVSGSLKLKAKAIIASLK